MCLTTNVKFIIYQLQNKSMIVNTLYYSIFYFILLYMIPMINALKPHEFRCRLFKLQQLLNSVNDVQHFLIEVIEISLENSKNSDQTLDMEEFQIDIMNDIQQKVFNSLVDSKSKMIKYEQLVNTVLYKNGHNFEENPQELINCLRACDGNKDSYINYDDFSEFIANWSPVMVNNVMQSNLKLLKSSEVQFRLFKLEQFLVNYSVKHKILISKIKSTIDNLKDIDKNANVEPFQIDILNDIQKEVFNCFVEKNSTLINYGPLIATVFKKNNYLSEENEKELNRSLIMCDINDDGHLNYIDYCINIT
ncbi:uncharacterized protein LOC126901522 isoform X5 [Daktulosphaira vitifoliae]|uniref:uncharacterized protein LOC126901522 isoform X5 n=1 Tax=Daktulosphaira vitifoliae TaxID=58002 RepID=UPI0021A9BD7B|nr:uncharacterized protein LOC126901522 isoform X5 [Daktulosphaira vitifoliae]